MNKEMLLYAGVLLAGTFISSVSQVLLKKAALKEHANPLMEYLDPLVIIAYVMFVGTTFMSVIAYKGIPLSMGPLLEASAYIYVTVFGVTIFHEKITKKKIISLLLIIGGIVVFSLAG